MKRIRILLPFFCLLVGYLLGNCLPLTHLLVNPKYKARFSSDYLIKAGTLATVDGGFSDSVKYPVEILFDHRDSPRPPLEPIRP